MESDFCLSEKIMKGGNYDYDGSSLIFTKDVKEFIRLLKKEFSERQYYLGLKVNERIDKLSGEKLK